eukprot:6787736-Prorocentrum_lima.AAC.1
MGSHEGLVISVEIALGWKYRSAMSSARGVMGAWVFHIGALSSQSDASISSDRVRMSLPFW